MWTTKFLKNLKKRSKIRIAMTPSHQTWSTSFCSFQRFQQRRHLSAAAAQTPAKVKNFSRMKRLLKLVRLKKGRKM